MPKPTDDSCNRPTPKYTALSRIHSLPCDVFVKNIGILAIQKNRVDEKLDVGKLGAEWEKVVESGSKTVNG